MQGLADGYFVLPNTINDYLSAGPFDKIDDSHPAAAEAVASVKGRIEKFLSINGSRTVDSFHKELGHIMWDYCGMERTEEGLRKAITRIRELKQEFWSDANHVVGTSARSRRPRTVRRCGTTTSTRTCRPGSSVATVASRSCTRSPWCTSTSR
jgi:succinate dehydrogenase/fumarate reductase flavoprotein subunit